MYNSLVVLQSFIVVSWRTSPLAIVEEALDKIFKILDKWYNPNLFEKDGDGVWHPKFKVGHG